MIGINRRTGIAASLYLALSYITGIIIFILVLRYPQITDDLEKVRIAVDMQSMVFITNLIMYVLFGPVLVLFIMFLTSRLEKRETLLIKFAAVTGFIWAGSLTASGMIANGALAPVVKLFAVNPDQAVYFWNIIDTVAIGLGNGNGEILGGLMTLGFSIAVLKDESFSNVAGILGIITGIIGIISLVPALMGLTAVFGMMQLVWFLIIGFSAGRKK